MTKPLGINALDIQKDYISVAQVDLADNSVQQIVIQPLSENDDSDSYWNAVSAELKALKKKFRFTRNDVACSIPSDMAVVKILEVESDEREQHNILRWELGAHLMGPVEDYAFDFYEVAPGRQADYRRYLAAAVRRETVAKLKKAVKGVNLSPVIMDLDLFALTNVFQANYRERLSDASILVHGENTRTKMTLVCNSSFVDYSIVGFEADMLDKAGYVAMLQSEISLLISQNSSISPAGQVSVYLAGSLFSNSQLAYAVTHGIPSCELLDPFRKLTCMADMDEEQLKTCSPQLAVSIGLALRGDENR
ncbi:MAG: pilus assembly protein PilM [Chitinispirillales bacterium]|jgi:type IV pilus assembly protein PilM|nr:pilus assembly protein PilM [Chitinispirillales bacterium]